MKTILGLDLGTNSIGWALIKIDHEKRILRIIGIGSRIIPMDAQEFSNFNAGQKIQSAAANRTKLHRTRITKERYLLRRDRLHLILNLLEALPTHYKIEIDFERKGKRCGQFKDGKEPKIAYLPTTENAKKFEFHYEDAFNEMIIDLQKVNPNIKNEKGKRVPKDWTIYYLRNKALKEKISLEELAWVLLSYNQKRGYEQIEVENKKEDDKPDELKEVLDLQVATVKPNEDKKGKYFEIMLNDVDNFTYKEHSNKQLTFENDIKEVVKISKLDDKGDVIPNKTTYEIAELYSLKLSKIEYNEVEKDKKKHHYIFVLENGWKFENSFEKKNKGIEYVIKNFEKANKPKDYVIRTNYDRNGDIVKIQGKDRSIKRPDFSNEKSRDWSLLKKKTEKEIVAFNIANGLVNENNSAKHYVSPKIYDVIQNDAKTGERTKIIGGLFQTIDRKFYREELYQIIETQREYHTNTLKNKELFEKCVKLLYPHNENHAKTLLENKDTIKHLLVEDILLFQRDIDSKKSDIIDCKYEIDYWKEEVDKNTGEVRQISVYKKAVSASHPLFQEFRIWDKIHNIKLIQLEGLDEDGTSETNLDVTKIYFKTTEDYVALYNHFNTRKIVAIKDYLVNP